MGLFTSTGGIASLFFDTSIDGSGELDIVIPLGEIEGDDGRASAGKFSSISGSNVTPVMSDEGGVTSSSTRGSEKQPLSSFLLRTLHGGRGVENSEKIESKSSEEITSPSLSDWNW